MPEQETIFLQEPGVLISNSQVTLGRHAYLLPDISQVSVEQVKPRPHLGFLALSLAALVVAYLTFRSFIGTLLVLIIVVPGIFSLLRPRPRYILQITAQGRQTQPAISLHASEIERLANAIQEARQHASQHTPAAYQVIDQESYTPPGAEGRFIRTVPQNCPKCDLPLTVETIHWIDNNQGECSRCQAAIEITWRKNPTN